MAVERAREGLLALAAALPSGLADDLAAGLADDLAAGLAAGLTAERCALGAGNFAAACCSAAVLDEAEKPLEPKESAGNLRGQSSCSMSTTA